MKKTVTLALMLAFCSSIASASESSVSTASDGFDFWAWVAAVFEGPADDAGASTESTQDESKGPFSNVIIR